jgi:chromosome segregation ATPase
MLLMTIWLLPSGQNVQAADDQRYLYQWKDDRGVVNLTDSLDKVPQKYRSQAKQLLQPGAGKEEQSGEETRERVQSQDLDAETSLDQDEIKKAEWQQRMHEAKRRLADAEDRYHQIELQKKELASKWGSFGAALPTQEVLNEMNRIEGELVRAKLDADRARTEVEVTIPDEARRADIPPGWLREVQ